MQQTQFSKLFANSLDQGLADSQLIASFESARLAGNSVKIIKAVLTKIGITHFSIKQIFKQGDIELPVMTFPNALNSKLAKLALGDHDIAVDYAFAGNSRPLLLSDITCYLDKAMFATRSQQKNRQLKELYGRFGFDDVLFLPTVMKGQSAILLFSMGSEDMPATEFQQTMLENDELLNRLARVVAQVGLAERPVESPNGSNDKKNELEKSAFELLSIMATRNINLKGAAALMGISSGVANKYIAAAKSILNTSSQSNVIYLATKQGRIKPDPVGRSQYR